VNLSHLSRDGAATALQVACVYGRSIAVIQELLKADAKVDILNSSGQSALLLLLDLTSITSECKLAIAHLLLEANCDVNVHVREKWRFF